MSLVSKTNLYRLNYTNLTRNKLLGHLQTLGAKYRKSDDENNDSPINFEKYLQFQIIRNAYRNQRQLHLKPNLFDKTIFLAGIGPSKDKLIKKSKDPAEIITS